MGRRMILFIIVLAAAAITGPRPVPSALAGELEVFRGQSDGQPADGRIEIQAVVAETEKPLEGASVVWQLRINSGKNDKTTSTTDARGRAVLQWPKGAIVNSLSVTVHKAGFVPYNLRADDNAQPIQLPVLKVLKLVRGIAVGGVLKDESGKPVAGASIRLYAPSNEANVPFFRFTLAEITSDREGRWRFDDAPANLAGVGVGIKAPRFLSLSGVPSRNLSFVTVLKRGFTVKGRVLDTGGKALAGANVSGANFFASEPMTKTDAHGEFVLENCPGGVAVVTVGAEGYAPDLREIHAEDQPTLEFRLGPGHTVRGKIVDKDGRPVPGATVAVSAWRTHRSLNFRVQAGQDGRFEWRGAPEDVVHYDVFKKGYMSRRRVALAATGAEHLVNLVPELIMSGRVTDAATGKPIPSFQVIRGLLLANNPRVVWMPRDSTQCKDGRFSVTQNEPYEGYAIRIQAPGYKPADSRVFKPDEVAPACEIALTLSDASDRLTGVVLRPDGKPAAGADVALATTNHPLVFERELVSFGRNNGMSLAKTGPDGRFSFDLPEGPYLVAALSDDGYAEATPAEFVKSRILNLVRWGKIRGEARIGRKQAADQIVSVVRRDRNLGPAHSFHNFETQTDARGRFVFERVIPGPSEVARVVVTELGNGSSQHMGCWQEPLDIVPGETTLARIGGKGRPVIGRIKLPVATAKQLDWRQNRPATLEKTGVGNLVRGGVEEDLHRFDRFAASLDKDGRFRIDDVPPGHYELSVTIDAPPAADKPGPAQELGRVKVSVEVPAGDEDLPVDLGEIVGSVGG
jgi:Carboxypeptidase regulatory-like domain